MKRSRLVGPCLMIGLVMSDCTYSPAARLYDNSLPITVGVRVASQPVTNGFSDRGPYLASRLRDANLFKSVLYPIQREDKADAIISARIDADVHTRDETGVLDILLLVFFLHLPADNHSYHYIASATFTLSLPGGEVLKSYPTRAEIELPKRSSHATTDVWNEDPEVMRATKDIVDQFIKQLKKDRAYFSALKSAR